MKVCDLNRILSYPREGNNISFARRFRALVISDGGYLTLGSVALFEMIVVMSSCLESCVVNMESHCSDLKALWQTAERIRFIKLIEVVK